jgi:predicted phosphodiesterase
MRIAILSDIHSNLPALRAVLQDMRKRSIDCIYSLGDTIGYGANPKECFDLIMSNIKVKVRLRGNHEDELVNVWKNGRDSGTRMNIQARSALLYSFSQLDESDIRRISTWPEIRVMKQLDITLAHGAVSFDYVWRYSDGLDHASFESKNSPTGICCLGHTHRPLLFSSRQNTLLQPTRPHKLNKKFRFAINVGSVGQPRDSNKSAAYGILQVDGKKKTYQLRRVSYDVEAAMKAVYEANLPEFFAQRLEIGR